MVNTGRFFKEQWPRKDLILNLIIELMVTIEAGKMHCLKLDELTIEISQIIAVKSLFPALV